MAELDARFSAPAGPVRLLPLSMASKPPEPDNKRCYGPAFTIAAHPTHTLEGPRPIRKLARLPKDECPHSRWHKIREVVTKKGIRKVRRRCVACLLEHTCMPDQVQSTYEKRRKA